MTMITPSYLGETIEYSSLHACRSTLEDPTPAWAEHTSWIAVDYVKGGIDLELEYAVLAGMCAEMLDGNCVGVYVPRERSFIPNDDSLLPELHRITFSRHHGLTQDRSRVN